MKFIDKKISESFYQIYIIIDDKEKKEILNDIKTELLEFQLSELKEQLNLYREILKSSNSEKSREKYNDLKTKISEININNIEIDKNKIENKICNYIIKDILEHIDTLNIIQVFANTPSIIGSLDDNNPLTINYSFCYISLNYEMQYPNIKGNGYLFTEKDIDMIQTELLIANGFYKKRKVLYITEFSDIQFSYMWDSENLQDIYMDINEFENKFNINKEQLLGKCRDTYLVKSEQGIEYYITIKEIYDKVVDDINDKIILELNYLETKTIKEFRKKIKEVFTFIYNVKSNVVSISQNIAKINNFNIDEYTKKNYCSIVGCDINDLTQEDIDDIKLSFVTAFVFANHNFNINKYYFYIQQEYNLLFQIKQSSEEMSFEDYINLKAPYYILYDFFKSKNLVTERSYNE